MVLELLECFRAFWCSLKKKEFLGEVWDFLEHVDPSSNHLDLPSGGKKLQTLWLFSKDLALGGVFPCFGPMVVDLVSMIYSRTFELHIWSLLSC